MKKIFQKMNRRNAILLLLFSVVGQTLLAQMPGGGMSPPKLNAIEKARIIKYDTEKVVKKLKITEDSITKEISKHIQTYNIEMDNLLILHSKTLSDLEKEFDRNVKIAMQNRDRSQMSGVKNKIKQIIPPIKYEVYEHEKVLNGALASILTEKQNKKWLKYQKQNNPNSTTF
jgi:hypothetical protein